MRALVACALLALSLPAAAQVYSYTDANGNTAYTNEPPPGSDAQAVDLPTPNAVAEQPQNNPPTANTSNAAQPAAPAQINIQIEQPQTQHSIDDDNDNAEIDGDYSNDANYDNDRLRDNNPVEENRDVNRVENDAERARR
jgi:hypothetical protein